MLALEADHVCPSRGWLATALRRSEQFQDALVVELDPALRVDHGHALLHVLQRGLQQRGLACQCGGTCREQPASASAEALLLQAQLL